MEAKPRRPGRPPKMTGGKRINFYLPQHVREWLGKQDSPSRAIVRLVEEQIKRETPA